LNAPDRSIAVADYISMFPQTFEDEHGAKLGKDDPRVDTQRLALLPGLIRVLNTLDGGEWGLCSKDDQGGKIPSDIVVWRPTREHFDVMTGTGPSWQPRGVMPLAWTWKAVPPIAAPPVVAPPVVEPPPDAPPPADDASHIDHLEEIFHVFVFAIGQLQQSITALDARLGQLQQDGIKIKWR
jgi:hypothetical protein